MPTPYRYAEIAIPGPMRRTFTYRLPASLNLDPGRRILVPFGRITKVGFYLGDAEKPTAFKVKDIKKPLDETSYFTPELIKFLRWMADYYFANPADCLLSALPPVLKKRQTAKYRWGTGSAEQMRIPNEFLNQIIQGKTISAATIRQINSNRKKLLRDMISANIISEVWPTAQEKMASKIIGYRCSDQDSWESYFANRRTFQDQFHGVKTRNDLVSEGWSDYSIRAAAKASVLEPVLQDSTGSVLEFIKPKADVSKLKLTDEQNIAYQKARDALGAGFKPFLLHGVTGSGKTIVYCNLCKDLLASGKTALVLTPEIALTGTTLAYFRGFFGDEVTVIHSSMTDRERLESWNGIRSGKHKIVIGPRSAIFAPVTNLGLVIVDEEHDGSYKQDDPSPRFHGRDCAVMRARMNNIPVILGSASPSMESFHNAADGRYQLLTLKKRPGKAKLPLVHLVNMKTERLGGDLSYMSQKLKQEIDQRIERNEQVILFINRRGHSSFLRCADCAHIPNCPHCDVRLTYHSVGNKLTCHYCGHIDSNHNICQKCGGMDVGFKGTGTQKVETNIPRLFKKARTLRLDSDIAFGRKKAYDILAKFAAGEADLLLGTQMVTKGLDLPEVTLVGALSGDAGTGLPDFRASEKAFARLLQVSGRCGRADKPGMVLIQTYDPEDPLITDAARQDYKTFYEREVESRSALGYPPFTRLINFVLSSENQTLLEKNMKMFKDDLDRKIKESKIKAALLGPAECPIYFLRGQYRRHLFIKTRQTTKLVNMLTDWEAETARFGLSSKVKIIVDVDPDSMM